jgi:hypothetical protein
VANRFNAKFTHKKVGRTVFSWSRLSVQQFRQFSAILALAVLGVNVGYAYEDTFTCLGDYQFVTRALGGKEDGDVGNRFSDSWLSAVPIPLPKNYVLGIDRQKLDFEVRKASYLQGQWRKGGWYHYYLYACLIKVPLGTLLLGLLAVGMTVWEWRHAPRNSQVGKDPLPSPLVATASHQSRPEGEETRSANSKRATKAHEETKRRQAAALQNTWRDEIVLLAPAVAVFVLVSSQTGFNHHLRYVLPAFPFLFIWISKVGRVFERQRIEGRGQRAEEGNPALTLSLSSPRRVIKADQRERGRWRVWLMRGVVAGALGWSVVSSLAVYPHCMSYFNELVGGPKGGHWHLGNSNVDWGQDLLYLKAWYEAHPEARPLHLAYELSLVAPSIVGIEHKRVPLSRVMNRPGAQRTKNWPWREMAADPDLPAFDQRLFAESDFGPFPGWHILSVNQLHSVIGEYEYFLEFEPVDWIGYSMMVFHITVEEANRVRRKLGLPEIEANDER